MPANITVLETMAPFKIYVVENIKTKEVLEVYKFTIELDSNDGRDTLSYLTTAIQKEIPYLQGKSVKIYWKDDEGDMVNVYSDACVRNFFMPTTIVYIQGSVPVKQVIFRLYVEVQPAAHSSSGFAHVGVACDGCNVNPVVGMRYKCLHCPNFDLCENCEKKGIHGSHSMIRFTDSYAWPNRVPINQLIKKRFLQHLAQTPGGSDVNREDHPFSSPVLEKRRRHGEKEGRCDRNHSDKEHAKRERGNHGNGRHCPVNSNMWTPYMNLASAAANAAATSVAAAASTAASVQDTPHLQFLKNLSKTLGTILDPLGVEVDIEMRPKEGETKATSGAAEKTPGETPQTSGQGNAGASQVAAPQTNEAIAAAFAEQIAQAAPRFSAALQQITQSLARQDMNDANAPEAGWTVINNEKEASPMPTEETQSATATTIYPNLAASAPAPPAVHPNPLLQEALNTLLSMGFTNDSGILTQILEINGGDFNKALDILTALRK